MNWFPIHHSLNIGIIIYGSEHTVELRKNNA